MRPQQVNDDREERQGQRPERRRVLPAQSSARHSRRGAEIVAKRRIERLVGDEARVVDSLARAA